MTRKTLKTSITVVISLAILIWCIRYLVLNFQWADIFQILQTANLSWLLLGGMTTLLAFCLIRSLRWYVLLQLSGSFIPYGILHLCNTAVMFLTVTTPFQSGELLKVELLKERGLLDRSFGYGTFAIERIADLFIVATIAAFGVLSGLVLASEQLPTASVLIFFLIFGAGIAGMGWLLIRWQSGSWRGLIGSLQTVVANPRSLLWTVTLSLVAWILVGLSWQVCLYSVQIELGFFQTLVMMAIVTIINILSFIPGGYGIAEVSIAQYLNYAGLSDVMAQTGAIMIRIQSVLLIGLSLVHLILWKSSSQLRLK